MCVFRNFNQLHVKDYVNSVFWCFSVLDSSNASNLFCLTVANNVHGCGLSIKYVYTSHVMNLKTANKTNDADSVLIKFSLEIQCWRVCHHTRLSQYDRESY